MRRKKIRRKEGNEEIDVEEATQVREKESDVEREEEGKRRWFPLRRGDVVPNGPPDAESAAGTCTGQDEFETDVDLEHMNTLLHR